VTVAAAISSEPQFAASLDTESAVRSVDATVTEPPIP